MVSHDADGDLADDIAEFYADPLGYVMYIFPWDTDPSIQLVKLDEKYRKRFNCEYGPDKWACEFLDAMGKEIKERGFDGKTAVDPIRFATVSGHGIGKSTLVAWLIKFILDTRPFSKGTVTANTDTQLRTKTWAELAKWHKRSLTEHWFTLTTGRGAMAIRNKEFPEEWFCTAQTSREENSESFAGQHAANSTSFYIFDEASGIGDRIYEVRDGGTTDGEPMIFDFGNPTRNSGRFFEECRGKFQHRFSVRKIDSREVAITNKDRLQQWIDDYGEDSDFVKVRIKGEFPSAGNIQFIPTADVETAMHRLVVSDPTAQLVIGVDVARFGDNESVIFPRLGMDARSFPCKRFMKLDTVQLVGKVIDEIRSFRLLGIECAGLFVDGGGIGGGVVDQLRHLGYNPIEVHFGGKPTDTNVYRYKGDEMWGNMREAIRTRLVLPVHGDRNGAALKTDLTQREYSVTIAGNKISLESKSDMMERGISSPDIADALAITFAHEVAPKIRLDQHHGRVVKSDYDPLEERW